MIFRSITLAIFFVFALAAGAGYYSVMAQTDDDVSSFLQAGQKCYERGDLSGAALEFENILLIDRQNFSARVWLAQVYVDLKDMEQARRLLREAALQAPEHPRVVQLQKMLGEIKKPVVTKAADPVISEAMVLIGSGTRLRPYGLVIPEDRVKADTTEKDLLSFDDVEIAPEKPQEKEIKLLSDSNEAGPLSDVFSALENRGLNEALDIYFGKVIADPSIAGIDDRGLMVKGNEVFAARFMNGPGDLEARYYYGALQFINGLYQESEKVLEPLKADPGVYAERLRPIFLALGKWRDQENQRIMLARQAEEERLAQEAYEKEMAEKQKEDVWAKIKKRRRAGSASGTAQVGGPAGGADAAEAAEIHSQGYELYKKGKLDEAIEKYEAALAKQADNAEYSYHLGLAWTDKGLAGDAAAFDQAVKIFQRVMSLAPDGKLFKDAQAMIKDIDAAKKSIGE
ncbi:MAG: tetratricopeptide repeat protein [Erysipelotrichia bacterium]|nr:tetratricopeptide repeat protein [Erysipelotrichia bacterium]